MIKYNKMTGIIIAIIALNILNLARAGYTETKVCYILTKDEVTNLFYLWNNALATENSMIVTNRYTDNAVLLATVSDQPRNTTALIKDYFDKFLLNKPQGVLLYSDPEPGCDQASDMGVYEFTFKKDGSKVKARYTYLYQYNRTTQEWKIAHHHSSMLPESFLNTNNGNSLKLAVGSLLTFLLLLLF